MAATVKAWGIPELLDKFYTKFRKRKFYFAKIALENEKKDAG
jgi:hypothetical protein